MLQKTEAAATVQKNPNKICAIKQKKKVKEQREEDSKE